MFLALVAVWSLLQVGNSFPLAVGAQCNHGQNKKCEQGLARSLQISALGLTVNLQEVWKSGQLVNQHHMNAVSKI